MSVHAVSVFLANPAALAVLSALSLGMLVWVGRDFSWGGKVRRETRRLARVEAAAHDEQGRRRPLGYGAPR